MNFGEYIKILGRERLSDTKGINHKEKDRCTQLYEDYKLLYSEKLGNLGKNTCPIYDIKRIYLTFLSNGSDKHPDFKQAKVVCKQWNTSSMKKSINKNNVKCALEQTYLLTLKRWAMASVKGEEMYTASWCGKYQNQ